MTAPRGKVGAAEVAGAAVSGAADVMGAEPAGGGGATPRCNGAEGAGGGAAACADEPAAAVAMVEP